VWACGQSVFRRAPRPFHHLWDPLPSVCGNADTEAQAVYATLAQPLLLLAFCGVSRYVLLRSSSQHSPEKHHTTGAEKGGEKGKEEKG
jgi:hypothetical protein